MDRLKVYAPYDGQELAELPLMPFEAVQKALESARQTFSDRKRWLSRHERIEILKKAIALIKMRREQFCQIAAQEGGKPWVDTQVEVERGVSSMESAIATLHTLVGEEVPMGLTPSTSGRLAFTVREPAGPVFAISAFNHPFNLIIHQVVPCIAAGCPVLIKPSLATPLTCKALVEVLGEAGLPIEWCQMILCTDEVTRAIAQDPRLAFLSFIGSAQVGWELRSRLAPGVRCQLEHGGAAPVIVFPDTDVESVIPLLTKGSFYHAGQGCVSVQRVYVHRARFEGVTEKLAESAKGLKVGDPLSPKTEVGPLIRRSAVDRVESWVKAVGGVVTGGKRLSESCYAPTVLNNPPPDALVSTQEIFGPVVCLYPFEELDGAIQRANSLPFCFQGAVFGRELDSLLYVAGRLKATAVMINDHPAFRADWMPFGGREHSGLGTGGIPYSIRELSPEKLIVIRSRL